MRATSRRAWTRWVLLLTPVCVPIGAACGSSTGDGAASGPGAVPSSTGHVDGGTGGTGGGGAGTDGGGGGTPSSTKDGGAPSGSDAGSSTVGGGTEGGPTTIGDTGAPAGGDGGSPGATKDGGGPAGIVDGSTGSADAGPTTGALIENDTFWKDTSGNPIYSQGGGVLQVGNTYYWYGVKYNGAVTYAAAPTKDNTNSSFAAVTCYSSTDLVTWKFENDVLVAGAAGSTLAPSWLGRLGVAYNATTKKYVLVSQYQGPAGNGELFATSSTPTGTFTFDNVQTTITNVANGTTGDQTLFIDDDGTPYLVCSSSMGRSNLYVAPLRAADYLQVEPATRIFGGPGREGNCMYKYNGRYYFNSSDLHGWNASHTYYISATNIMGPYSAEAVITNTDADFSHVSQTGFFVTVHGTAGTTVIFAGDRWSDFAGNGLGYNQWVPLSFNGTAPAMQSVSEWSLDAAAGTWAVGPHNNYALNPSFEADRVTMTQPAGWVTTTNLTGATPYTNASGGHTGNWLWQLSYTAAYQAALTQTVTGLPDGTYTLGAWVKSSGGQSVAQLFAKGYGGAELDASLTSPMTAWTHVTIPNIAVTNGTCVIGVQTTASANQDVDVDDFTLIKN